MSYRKCPDCDGSNLFGCDVGDGKCSNCHGNGLDPDFLTQLAESVLGTPGVPCPTCHGSGQCQTCSGSGQVGGLFDPFDFSYPKSSGESSETSEARPEERVTSSRPEFQESSWRDSGDLDSFSNSSQGGAGWAVFSILIFFLLGLALYVGITAKERGSSLAQEVQSWFK